MSNLRFWDAMAKPPAEALKPIRGGRMNGKTNIDPTWRLKAITESFGPAGIGWYYTIDRQWLESGDGEQQCAFCNISLYVKDGDEWSKPIPGTGGSMLIEREKAGPHTSDEAFKMALTDALSVAMKALGIAADIYLGMWDGSKYRDEQPKALKRPPKEEEDENARAKVLGDGLKYVGLVNDAQGANSMLNILKTTEHVGDSKAVLWKALKERAEVIGCVYNGDTNSFEEKT